MKVAGVAAEKATQKHCYPEGVGCLRLCGCSHSACGHPTDDERQGATDPSSGNCFSTVPGRYLIAQKGRGENPGHSSKEFLAVKESTTCDSEFPFLVQLHVI